MKLTQLSIFMVLFLSLIPTNKTTAQGIGLKLGTEPGMKDPNAVLDLGTGSKGLLLPRVTLSSTTSASPLVGSPFGTAAPAGMSVYNTATANDANPGFYYSDGTKWNKIQSNGNGLTLSTLQSNTAITATNSNTVILASANVTLPTASNANKGNVYIIRNTNASTDISVNSIVNFGANTPSSYTLTALEGAITVVSGGANWIRIQ